MTSSKRTDTHYKTQRPIYRRRSPQGPLCRRGAP